MMTTTKQLVAVMALAFGCMATTGNEARAQNKYALVSFHNNTSSVTIKYSFKWGSGSWKTIELKPGHTHWHSWKLEHANQKIIPQPYVRYDLDVGPKKMIQVTKVKAYAGPTQGSFHSRKYQFTRLQSINGIVLKDR